MNGKDCRTARLEIDRSELGQRLSEPAESHIAGCAACAQFRTERAQLRELVGSLKPVAAPPDFDMRLRARIARERDSQARQPFIFRFALTTPVIAVAALLVFGIAAIVWINQSKQRPVTETVAVTPTNDKPANNAPATAGSGNQDQKSKEEIVAVKQPDTPKRPNQSGRNGLKTSTGALVTPQVSEFNTGAAQSIRQTRDRKGEVSLAAPSQPMVISVQDANGETHKILLPPITFGSQRFDNRTPVSMTNRKDW